MNHVRKVLKLAAGFAVGAVVAAGSWMLSRHDDLQHLGRRQLVEYCRLFANGGELRGGAGGALGWRCLDHSDPTFDITVGLYDINNYCRNKYPRKPRALILDIHQPSGWACTTDRRAADERTVMITVDADSPPVGTRKRDQGVIPIVDSPNRYLDADGRMNLRARQQVAAFCIQELHDSGAPPYMYGVITPTLQRGFIRSDFTATPSAALPLPNCQPVA